MNARLRAVKLWILVPVLLLGGATVAGAADLETLQERFKQRYAELLELKTQGVIGETWQGYVDFVKASNATGSAKALVDAENADRRELYQLLAEKEKTTAAKVAERNAVRNFSKARSGEWLKDRDGWRRK